MAKKQVKKKKATTPVERKAAVRKHLKRTRADKCRDEMEINRIVKNEPDIAWMQNPHQSDVLGIDVPTYVHPITGKMRIGGRYACSPPDAQPARVHGKGKYVNPIYLKRKEEDEWD